MKKTTQTEYKPTMNEILKATGNLNMPEMEMAYDAFELGEGFRGRQYGISAAFVAGMIYGARKAREKENPVAAPVVG